MPAAGEPAVRLERVGLIYRPEHARPVVGLREVSLEIAAGELVAVTGPSGSGKSSLLHVMAGLLPATEGRVELLGHDLATLGDDALTLMRRRRVGFVFQFFNLLPHLTAAENVAFPLLLDGVSYASALARAHEAVALVGLERRADHRPEEMSGGELQRTAIARALLIRPRALFADEPTGNLDSSAGAAVLELLARVRSETGALVVIVSHDPRIAAIADRSIEMHDGAVARERRGR